MRTPMLLAAAIMVAACATSGPYPEIAGAANQDIATAERLLGEVNAMAPDALAEPRVAAVISSARDNLQQAQSQISEGRADRAAAEAREAQLDARYAMSLVRQIQAERQQQEARTALDALPPGGAR